MKFFTTLNLPSLGKSVKIYELKYEDYINAQKFLQNNRNDDIEYCIEQVLMLALGEAYADLDLSCIDKLMIILMHQIISVRGVVEFTIKQDDGIVIHKIDLLVLLNKLINSHIKYKDILLVDNVEYTLTISPLFKASSMIEHAYNTLSSIKYPNGVIVRVKELTPSEKEKLLEYIPATVVRHLYEFSRESEETINTITVNLPLSEESTHLSSCNGVILEIIKLICKSNLGDVYRKMYSLSSGPGILVSDTMQLTPVEVDLLYSFLEQEVKEMENSNKSTGRQHGSN